MIIEDYLFVIWLINSSTKMFIWLTKIKIQNDQFVDQFVDWSNNRRANNPLDNSYVIIWVQIQKSQDTS